MKRFHVNLTVADLDASVQFYTHLFAAHPTVQRSDYAKWLLDDPRVNFAITTTTDCGVRPGLSHLGIQAESAAELDAVYAQMQNTQGPVSAVEETTCCYAKGQKGWAIDPQGIAWEGFFTEQDGLETFGEGRMPTAPIAVKKEPAAGRTAGGCCS